MADPGEGSPFPVPTKDFEREILYVINRDGVNNLRSKAVRKHLTDKFNHNFDDLKVEVGKVIERVITAKLVAEMAPTTAPKPSPAPTNSSMRMRAPYNPAPGTLSAYYRFVFPIKQLTRWLCYGQAPEMCFARREFAQGLERNGEEVHLRFRSYACPVDFEKDLIKVAPSKLDIGAVYSHAPKDRLRYGADFKPVERELVFDVDLDEFDCVRRCCRGATVCGHCWKFIVMAIVILERTLKEDLGYKYLLWCYSGRSTAGSAMRVPAPSATTDVSPLPTTSASSRYGSQAGPSSADASWSIVGGLRSPSPPSNDRSQLSEGCRCTRRKAAGGDDRRTGPPAEPARYFIRHFVLSRVYPRLDTNVSTGVNHLLKSPFCIHPKTGCVAVPLDTSKVHEFDVLSAPRVDLLLEEVRALWEKEKTTEEGGEGEGGDKENRGTTRKALDYKRTALGPHIAVFEKFVASATGSK